MVDDQAQAILSNYLAGSEHPDFVAYRRKFQVLSTLNRDAIFWRLRYFCRLGHFFQSRILEVGSGFGWDAVLLSLIGNNHVVASDILPSMVDGMTECLATLEAKGYSLSITPTVGDICTMDMPSKSFDGIYCAQAIEHVHDVEVMFDNCRRMLRPGGRMIIVNDNNVYNAETLQAALAMWKERDTSWSHAEHLRTVRPVEHADARPYSSMREIIVEQTRPELNREDRRRIVEATAGLTRTDIVDATNAFCAGHELPTPPAHGWCRNPETGEYAERLLDPFEMLETLKQYDFKARVVHAFRRLPLRMLNSVRWPALNKFLFNLRPVFVIVAERA